MAGTSRHQSAVQAIARVKSGVADLVALLLHGNLRQYCCFPVSFCLVVACHKA